jgi:hypothetical protein
MVSKRNSRNHIIEGLRADKEITNTDASFMFIISDMLGEDDVIDLDFDEISEATGIEDPTDIEDMLDFMHDIGIVDVNYEDQTISEPME